MPTIAVIGPGAVGGAVAAWLSQNPENDVTVATRTPFRRLVVEVGGHVLRAAPRLITEPAEAAPVDWVLVATKAYAVRGTAMWFPGFTEDHTRIAILQNGVEHVERFAPYVPADRVLPVMVDLPAERRAPGRVRQSGSAHLAIARSPDGAEFAELFAGTGIRVTQEEDMTSVLWRKLCLNAGGAIPAATLSSPRIARHPAIARFLHEVVEECIAVGRAEGANLEDDIADRVVAGAQSSSPSDALNSLHADRLAGRPMEIDARNGAIVRIGRRHGIPTPQNALLVSLLEGVASVSSNPGRIGEATPIDRAYRR